MTNEFEARFLSARKAVIAARFADLNEMQREAALATEGPLLLLAGAGSGKTTVLIRRIANLISFGCGSDSDEIPDYVTEADVEFLEQYLKNSPAEMESRAAALCALKPVAPWNIIAITFTNKAAGELKDRLLTMLGAQAEGIWAMTFHSACCRMLRRDADRLGYESSFTIYDTADSERVIKDVLKERNLDEKTFPPRMVLTELSRAKERMQSPDEYDRAAASSGDFRAEKLAEIYTEYQKRLVTANAVDFDDILLLAVRLLQENEDIRTYYQQKFRYVLIDEYQDTNKVQYLLASLLAGKYENICVVGDDDQSIYKFRGATIDNILNFEKEYRGARVIRLEQNYRSMQTILNAANAVIANNRGRKGKKLWTNNAEGEKVTVYEASNEADEANFVANRIFHAPEGESYRDYAILYRTNAQSNALEYALKRNAIPYRIIGGTRFFDRAEVKDMVSYLCLVNNADDDLRLRRVINNPPRGIGAKTLEMAARQAEAANLPLYRVIENAASYPSLEKAAAKLAAFTELIGACRELVKTMPLPDFYDELLARTGYLAMLEQKNDVENRTRAENVRELRSSILNYLENTDEPSLSGFLEEIALYTDIEQYDASADAVVMMTMHAAKGLEFDNVCLVGLEEGLFPSSRALNEPDEMEEERRLCYVAITRAKKTLAISYAGHRMLYGRTSYNRPSRFVRELPEECVAQKASLIATRQDGDRVYAPPVHRAAPVLDRKEAYSSMIASSKATRTPAKFIVNKGDMVEHQAFGAGMVLSSIPMGNDALLEIAFDNVGTKRLMANAASQYMKKR